MTDRSAIGRASKARGKADERRWLAVVGATRFPADTGGKLDGKWDGHAVQIKGGPTVASVVMREALAEARAGAGPGELPCVGLVDRRARPIQEWICFPLKEWAAWNGYGGTE